MVNPAAPAGISFADFIADADAHPPMLVAELSANHNGDRSRFLELIEAAASSGATAVKFQTYTPDSMTLDVDLPEFKVKADHELWGSRSLYELYEEAQTPYEWHAEGFELARKLGMYVFSSPFDFEAVQLLESLDTDAFKIASLELTDTELVRACAETGRPVVMSSGAATNDEIAVSVEVAKRSGAGEVVLLLCTSSYPARPDDSNLRTIAAWQESFGISIGLSDHTTGTAVSIAAAALGARLIERHFTLSRDDGGVDSAFSLDPDDLKRLSVGIDEAWRALGSVRTEPMESELESRRLRRSLYVTKDVKAGDTVTAETVKSLRPGYGLPSGVLPDLQGRTFARDAQRATPMSWDLLADGTGEESR